MDKFDAMRAFVRIVEGARSGDGLPYVMRKGNESVNLNGRHSVAIDDGNAYLAAGLAGLGVLWLPDYMAKPHVAGGALAPLFDGWHIEPMPLTMMAMLGHRSVTSATMGGDRITTTCSPILASRLRKRLRWSGSRPAVGSSTITRRGEPSAGRCWCFPV